MLDTKTLQEIAQDMADTQRDMEDGGDAEIRWTTPEIARQDLQDQWAEDAGAFGIEDIDVETRDRLWDMVVEAYFGPSTSPDPETEEDPMVALVRCIRDGMPGLVRHDLDAMANGWDPHEDPESGYIWQEAERRLLAASGDEELDDDIYADLADTIANTLPGPEDMDNEEEE